MKERILKNIGNSFNQLQQLNEAIDFYQQAILAIDSSDLADEDYKRGRKEELLSNMGLAYLRKRDYLNALNIFEKCLNLYNNHEDNNLSKIICINNFASLYRIVKEYEKADNLLSDGLNCLSNMDFMDNIQRDEIVYSQAILSQGRGNVAVDKGDFDKARLYYQETISILQLLYDKNPRKYVVSLAIANFNHGRSYFIKNEKSKEALPSLENSINLYESVLHNSYIQQLADNYAEAISILGRIYINRKDTTECIRLCGRINQTLKSCSDFPYKGANLLAAVGSIYADLKMYENAIEYYGKAVNAMEMMYAEYPTIYKSDLSRLYTNIAITHCRIGNLDEGKDCFARGLSMLEELYLVNKAEKKDYMDALNRGFMFLGTTSEYLTGLVYLRKMQELEPNNKKLFEYECIILAGNGHKEEAKKAFSKLLNHFPDYPKDSKLYNILGSK